MIAYQHLDWDSDFFGFKVARADLPQGTSDINELRLLLSQQGYRLCYVFAPDEAGSLAASAVVAPLVDERVQLGARLPRSCSSNRIEPDLGKMAESGEYSEADRLSLTELALQSAERSRFRTDPRMPTGSWIRLYESWMAQSLNGRLADAVLVKRVDEAIVGMLTVACRDGIGSIGLFAVAASARGRGIGRALLQEGERWFLAQGCTTASVVTQGGNLPALHAYRQAGYRVEQTTFVHHLWLDPEPAD